MKNVTFLPTVSNVDEVINQRESPPFLSRTRIQIEGGYVGVFYGAVRRQIAACGIVPAKHRPHIPSLVVHELDHQRVRHTFS